jgi:homoserine kinase
MASAVTPFVLRVPATTANLGPGFGVLGLALERWLEFTVGPAETTIVSRTGQLGPSSLDTRHDPVVRGLRAGAERFSIKFPGEFAIEVQTEVPRACGFGTNTAELVGGIQLACRFAKEAPSLDDRLTLLVAIGGDRAHGAAALRGGLTATVPRRVVGSTHTWRLLSLPISPIWRFVAVAPQLTLGTADVHRVVPAMVPNAVAQDTAGRLVGLIEALARGDAEQLADCLCDETHVPYRLRLAPGMAEAVRAGEAAGAAGVTISGHGPALLALTTDESTAQRTAAAMREAFTAVGIETAVDIIHKVASV